MADTVRYLMEEMIPELEDLERKGYFSKAELKQIVKKREDFEYKLKRRAALKQDYLRYIEYERKVDDLRKLRRKSMGVTGKKTLGDYAMVRRIHFVFQRCTRKFAGDISLWMSWLEFCKASKSDKQFSKAVTKALQLHPKHAGLWSYAAAWEFEHNGNPTAARALMQQGLRMCPQEESIWVEYFRMELLYVHKLRARRSVLGLNNPGEPPTSADPMDTTSGSAAADAASLAASSAEDGAGAETAAASGSAADSDAVSAVLTGSIAAVVARSAVKALPHSLSLRSALLGVLRDFTFPGVSAIAQQLYSGLEADMQQNEDAWELLARRHCPDASTSAPSEEAAAAASATYERAVQAQPSAKMFMLYTAFLRQLMDSMAAREATVARAAAAAKQLLDVHEHAHHCGACSAEMYGQWARLATQLQQRKMVKRALEHGCQKFPQSATLWRQRIELEAQATEADRTRGGSGTAGCSGEGLREVLQQALTCVRGDDVEQLWLHAIQLCSSSASELEMLEQRLVVTLSGSARGPLRGGLGAVAAALVEAVRKLQGIERARLLYARLLKLPAAGGELFLALIRMERSELPPGGRRAWQAHGEQVARVQRLFDAAVDAYGSVDTELWLEFASFESEARGSVGQVYWRASKALQDPEEFIQKYREVLGLV